MSRPTHPCPDCGHPMPYHLLLDRHSLTLHIDGDDFRLRFERHVILNPDLHPTFVISGPRG